MQILNKIDYFSHGRNKVNSIDNQTFACYSMTKRTKLVIEYGGNMATAFSENERELIRTKLKSAAQECLQRYGAKKTTVDQLVQMTGISKGAFYSFYPSKEILFFKLIEEYQKSLFDALSKRLDAAGTAGVQQFSELIYELYMKVRHSFLMNLIQNREFDYLMRKIPESYVLEHHLFDETLMQRLLTHFKLKKGLKPDIAAASLRAVFMCMLHEREVSENDFDAVLLILIKGVAEQLIEEDGAVE